MSEETAERPDARIHAHTVIGELRDNAVQLKEWLEENAKYISPDTAKDAEEKIKAAQESLDQQEVMAAQQALASVKQELEAAASKSPEAAQAVRALSSIKIVTVEDARQASTTIRMAQQTEQQIAGTEIQKAVGEALGAVVTGVTTVAQSAFGPLLTKETMEKINQWNAKGIEGLNMAFASLCTEAVQPGATKKDIKDKGLEIPS